MIFRDSLLDSDRAPLRPLGAWIEELIDHCEGSCRPAYETMAKVQNNHAFIALHVAGADTAMALCDRQIEWSFRAADPDRAVQPFVNQLRIHRIKGDRQRQGTWLDALRVMAMTGAGRIGGHAPFVLSNDNIQLCAANYVKEVFQAAGPDPSAPSAEEREECEAVTRMSALALATYIELHCMAACRSGDADRLGYIGWADRSETGNYLRAVLTFYQAVFAAEWSGKSTDAEALLARIAGLIEAASLKTVVDHRILRFAAAASRAGRHLSMPDLEASAGSIVGTMADALDDVGHQVYHRHEILGDIAEATRIASASGYEKVGSIGSCRDGRDQARLAANLCVLDEAVREKLRAW